MSCLLDLDKYLHKRSLSILVSDSSVALQALEVLQDTTEAIDQWQFACWFTIAVLTCVKSVQTFSKSAEPCHGL